MESRLSVKNVVCVHSKNGDRRSALAIASYLMFSGRCDSSPEAFGHFARRRGLAPHPASQADWVPPTYHRYLQYATTSTSFSAPFPYLSLSSMPRCTCYVV